MPLTTTVTWPDLVAGKKAKASEVEAKFDYLEGSIWPMAAGVATDNAFDIGLAASKFRTGYFGSSVFTPSLNPTTTAAGVAIGKAAAGDSTCLDMSAMPKAMLLPIVTTVQQAALTATAGMLVFNSTNARMERYEGGQWLPMANYYGFLSATFTASTGAYATALSVTGSGRLLNIFAGFAAGNTFSTNLIPTIDGVTYGTSSSAVTTSAISFVPGYEETVSNRLWTVSYASAGVLVSENNISQSFKTSISISAKSTINVSEIRFDYEVV